MQRPALAARTIFPPFRHRLKICPILTHCSILSTRPASASTRTRGSAPPGGTQLAAQRPARGVVLKHFSARDMVALSTTCRSSRSRHALPSSTATSSALSLNLPRGVLPGDPQPLERHVSQSSASSMRTHQARRYLTPLGIPQALEIATKESRVSLFRGRMHFTRASCSWQC